MCMIVSVCVCLSVRVVQCMPPVGVRVCVCVPVCVNAFVCETTDSNWIHLMELLIAYASGGDTTNGLGQSRLTLE